MSKREVLATAYSIRGVRVECPECGNALPRPGASRDCSWELEYFGKVKKCPNCGTRVRADGPTDDLQW